MQSSEWQPSASIETLRERAQVLAQVRSFFAERSVMEVDTQSISQAAVSDPFIDSLPVAYQTHPAAEIVWHYLQSSPEYAMKRLLAAGSGAIYQLSKVFRNGELGRLHNPEFTMLEWYRPGFCEQQLMHEVRDLVDQVLGPQTWCVLTYRELFIKYLDIDPFDCEILDLQTAVRANIDAPFEDDRKDTWLELAMSELIEPLLNEPTLVEQFPASQAALAQVSEDAYGNQVATRFELYAGGMEIANGYRELQDPDEQARRLAADMDTRKALGLPIRPTETRLVSALSSGLPDCSGVALGFDRLLMLKLGAQSIADVIPFGFERA